MSPLTPTLTRREREIMQLVAQGMPCFEIAQVLGISARTVECHTYNIRMKLGARNSAHATALFMQQETV